MIGFSPEDVFQVESSIDEGCATRVKFAVRAVSVADRRKVNALVAASIEAPKWEDQNAKLNAALLIGVVGWSLPRPFDAEGLDSELTLPQKQTLAIEYPLLVELGEIEKKVSRSSRKSVANESAKGAAAGVVMTSPTN